MSFWEYGVQESYRLGRRPTGRFNGYAMDTTGPSDARDLAIASTPSTWKGMLRTGLDIDRMTTTDFADAGDFHCVVTYGMNEVPEEDEVRFSASTKGGREKVTQAIATTDSIGVDATHPASDTGGAIGLDEQGNVNGVEIIVPKPVFSLEMHVDFSLITDAYWTALELATGRVNSSDFRGRKAHEVLFQGADFDGAIRVDSNEVQLGRLRFDFAVSREVVYDPAVAGSGLVVEGLERGITKRGWDYLDIRYGEFIDGTSKTKVRRPVEAASRQVMNQYDFNRFGLN
jgi:hypothetical protein